ncbi:hypothetical protein D9M68_614740 [compost metagenome]
MVLSNSATIASKPLTSCTAPLAKPASSALERKPSRSMWRPIDSSRQASSRVMRSVCAPVMAANAVLADSSARRAALAAKLPSPACSAARRRKSLSARTIWFQLSCDSRSRTAAAACRMLRRL